MPPLEKLLPQDTTKATGQIRNSLRNTATSLGNFRREQRSDGLNINSELANNTLECWHRPGSHVPFPVFWRLRLCFRRTSEPAFILVILVFSILAFWHQSGFPDFNTARHEDTMHVVRRTRTGDLFVLITCYGADFSFGPSPGGTRLQRYSSHRIVVANFIQRSEICI